MIGRELAEEALDWVQDVSFDETSALALLNRAQVAVASRLLLPGLSDGYDTVTTDPLAFAVAVPDDYMKALYHAQTANGTLTVYQNMALFLAYYPRISPQTGPVSGVVAINRQLVYQPVPNLPTEITLRYYRRPTPMTTRSDSYPDGVEFGTEIAEQYEKALVHYAAKEMWAKLEQGEGSRPDTSYHNGEYERFVALLEAGCPKAVPHPKPPICESNW